MVQYKTKLQGMRTESDRLISICGVQNSDFVKL